MTEYEFTSTMQDIKEKAIELYNPVSKFYSADSLLVAIIDMSNQEDLKLESRLELWDARQYIVEKVGDLRILRDYLYKAVTGGQHWDDKGPKSPREASDLLELDKIIRVAKEVADARHSDITTLDMVQAIFANPSMDLREAVLYSKGIDVEKIPPVSSFGDWEEMEECLSQMGKPRDKQ